MALAKKRSKARFKPGTWVRVIVNNAGRDGSVPEGVLIKLGLATQVENEDGEMEIAYEIEGALPGETIMESDVEALSSDDLIDINTSVPGGKSEGPEADSEEPSVIVASKPGKLAIGDGTPRATIESRIKDISEEMASLKDVLVWMDEAKTDALDDLEYRIFTAIRKLDHSPSKVEASKIIAKLLGNEIRAASKKRK